MTAAFMLSTAACIFGDVRGQALGYQIVFFVLPVNACSWQWRNHR